MIGTWIVDFNEPSCKPWWRDSRDHVCELSLSVECLLFLTPSKGCTSRHSGIHVSHLHLVTLMAIPNDVYN